MPPGTRQRVGALGGRAVRVTSVHGKRARRARATEAHETPAPEGSAWASGSGRGPPGGRTPSSRSEVEAARRREARRQLEVGLPMSRSHANCPRRICSPCRSCGRRRRERIGAIEHARGLRIDATLSGLAASSAAVSATYSQPTRLRDWSLARRGPRGARPTGMGPLGQANDLVEGDLAAGGGSTPRTGSFSNGLPTPRVSGWRDLRRHIATASVASTRSRRETSSRGRALHGAQSLIRFDGIVSLACTRRTRALSARGSERSASRIALASSAQRDDAVRVLSKAPDTRRAITMSKKRLDDAGSRSSGPRDWGDDD